MCGEEHIWLMVKTNAFLINYITQQKQKNDITEHCFQKNIHFGVFVLIQRLSGTKHGQVPYKVNSKLY